MTAFAVDMSWLVLARSELQNAADAAALAGANRLGDNYVLFSLKTQTAANKTALIKDAVSTAKASAKTYAAANSAGGVSSLVLLDSDIDVGYTNASGTFTSNSTDATLYPNTIKVTLRRDSTANTSLSMFFAPTLGISTVDVQAQATAMGYGGRVDSFRTSGPQAAGMLPVTFDVTQWNSFVKTGKDSDGNTTTDANGNPEIQLYPSISTVGNFGWISLNDAHVGASTLNSWITNGPTNNDIQALVVNGLIPLSGNVTPQWSWDAENGFKSSDVQTVNVNVGNTYVIPLFRPFSSSPYQPAVGQGSNFYYDIVAFVGVKLVQPADANRQVVVMPVPITDPTMILLPSSIAPLASSGDTSVTALAPPKLTN
jgi:hypothetical protein